MKVVEAGSLTGAADSLNVAQPALGLQIRNLEEELGVPLITRHSRGVQPTPAGELLCQRAVGILQSMDVLRQEIRDFAQESREVIRFGITPSTMRLLGPDFLIEAREMIPDAFFSLFEELSFLLVDALESGELDAAFSYKDADRPNLSSRAIFEEELLLVSSPEFDPSSEPIAFSQAVQRDLVLASSRDIVRRLVDDTAAQLSVPVNVVYETQSVPATRNLLQKGLASGIMPYGSVVVEVEAGTLCARRIVEPAIVRTLYLIQRLRQTPFRSDEQLNAFLDRAIGNLTKRLDDLCRPVEST